jgi:hypothetical protein
MKSIMIASSVCLAMLTATGVTAPRSGKARMHQPHSAKTSAITEIRITEIAQPDIRSQEDGSPLSGQTWTLWPNRMNRYWVEDWHSQDAVLKKDANFTVESAKLDPKDFARLSKLIQTSRLFNLSAPKKYWGAVRQISIVRSGKRQTVLAPYDALSPVQAAGESVAALLGNLANKAEWKNPAGLNVDTGIDAQFVPFATGLPYEESMAFDTPIFSVLNAGGKEATTVRYNPNMVPGFSRQVLAPGTYRLVFKKLNTDKAQPNRAEAKGYHWIAVPSTVQIKDGQFTQVNIKLAKLPVAP